MYGLFVATWIAASVAFADFSGSVNLRSSEHLNSPMNPASQRGILRARELVKSGEVWSGVAAGHYWYELNPGESDQVKENDRQEARFDDLYVQARSENWILRAGQ